MHLLGRGLAAHLVGRGGVGFQVGPIGGEAVVEHPGHMIAHLLVAGGFLGDDGGQVHRLVQREPLARRVAVGEVAEDAGGLRAELVEHHAHDGLGIHVLGHGVGLGEQEALQRVLAGAFQKRVVGRIGARVLGSGEESLGGDAAAVTLATSSDSSARVMSSGTASVSPTWAGPAMMARTSSSGCCRPGKCRCRE